jgi:hypothetical protein
MNTNKSGARRQVATAVIAACLAGNTCVARADLVSTDRVVPESEAHSPREKVRSFLEREDAQRRLVEMGVAPESAKERVDRLTDAEAATIAGKIDSVPAGGALSTTEWILIVLIAILVAILI